LYPWQVLSSQPNTLKIPSWLSWTRIPCQIQKLFYLLLKFARPSCLRNLVKMSFEMILQNRFHQKSLRRILKVSVGSLCIWRQWTNPFGTMNLNSSAPLKLIPNRPGRDWKQRSLRPDGKFRPTNRCPHAPHQSASVSPLPLFMLFLTLILSCTYKLNNTFAFMSSYLVKIFKTFVSDYYQLSIVYSWSTCNNCFII